MENTPSMLNFSLWPRRRIHLVRQSQMAECGIACLLMIANYHGLNYDLPSFRAQFTPSLRGITLRSIMGLATKIGLLPRPIKISLEELSHIAKPAILHWDMNHFVVLERTQRGRALIHNPDGRSMWLTTKELSEHFTGVALELRPGDAFQTGNHRATLAPRQLYRKLGGGAQALIQVGLLSLILQVFVIGSPYFLQIAIDTVLPSQDHNLLYLLATGFALFAIINAIATLLRSAVLLTAGTCTGFGLATNLAAHLFKLPVEWYSKRQTGDVLSRFQSLDPIQKWLTRGAAEALIDGPMAVLTLSMMILYSRTLASISIVAVILYLGIRTLTFRAERTAQEASIIAGGKEHTTLIETIRGIEILRLFNAELVRHTAWQNRLAEYTNADLRHARITIIQNAASVLIFGLENVAVILVGIKAVMGGDRFTLGMFFAYMTYRLQFVTKASALADQFAVFRMLRLHLDRISDIVFAKQDPAFLTHHRNETLFKGALELRDISFRYSTDDPLILDSLNLVVEAGEHIAITGPSGGGKSTLSRIILGLLQPTLGTVLIDKQPLSALGYQAYRERVGAVLQEDHLFSGSIAQNIAFFDPDADQEKIREAASAASIHADILAMPMGYETPVGDMGSTLSGGQKQRILLARALYRSPRLLLMDEGTAHLDVRHEEAVNQAIKSMGITRIVIAHRRETIEAADRVLYLADGKLSEIYTFSESALTAQE